MTALRRRVRLWTTLWLILQAGTLSAFVPRDCCATHRPAATAKTCHEEPPPEHCPMRGADGAPCPMHREPAAAEPVGQAEHAGHAGHDDHAAQPEHTDHAAPEAPADATPAENDCVMRGTCRGATVAIAFSYPGILTEPTPVPLRTVAIATFAGLSESPVARRAEPDPQPPRA